MIWATSTVTILAVFDKFSRNAIPTQWPSIIKYLRTLSSDRREKARTSLLTQIDFDNNPSIILHIAITNLARATGEVLFFNQRWSNCWEEWIEFICNLLSGSKHISPLVCTPIDLENKRMRKTTKTNKYKTNKQMHEKHTDQLLPSPSEEITMLKGMTKHEDKELGKNLKHETPCSINHRATQNKNNTGTTALERSVA